MSTEQPRALLVTKTDGKKFKVVIPVDAKVTFGPWSPPTEKRVYNDQVALAGTLRVYKGTGRSTENILGVWSGIAWFYDTSLIDFAEEIVKIEGEAIWKSDKDGYVRKTKENHSSEWVHPLLGSGNEEDAF